MIVCKDLNENRSISNEEQLDIAKNVGNIVSNCMQKFMLESREKLQELVTGDLSADWQMEELRETVGQYLLFCPDELRKYLEGFRYQEIEDVVNFRIFYQIWLNLHDCYGEKLIEMQYVVRKSRQGYIIVQASRHFPQKRKMQAGHIRA